MHGPGVDEPLAIERKGKFYYYHADGLGSITALTDAKQKIVESYDYDSFGRLQRHGGKVKNTYTFTGREWDKEIGLYYYRARYYDPEVGRFVTPDPSHFIQPRGTSIPYLLPFLLTRPIELNLYLYAKNNPANLTDPTGLSSKCCGGWRGAASRLLRCE